MHADIDSQKKIFSFLSFFFFFFFFISLLSVFIFPHIKMIQKVLLFDHIVFYYP